MRTACTLIALAVALATSPALAQDANLPGWTRGWSKPVDVHALAFSPDGEALLVAGDDHVQVWDLARGEVIRRVEAFGASQLAVAPNGLVVATGHGKLLAWPKLGAEALPPIELDDYSDDLALDPTGARVAIEVGIDDRAIVVFDLERRKKRHTLKGHTAGVNALAFSPDGKLLASAAQDGTIRLWDVEAGKHVRTCTAEGVLFSGVAFSADGAQLVTSDFSRMLRAWDVASGEQRWAVPAGQKVQAFALVGERVATGHWGGALRLWSWPEQRLLGEVPLPKTVVGDVALSASGKRLAFVHGIADTTLELWFEGEPPAGVRDGDAAAADSGKPWTGTLPEGYRAVCLSPDGRELFGQYALNLKAWRLVRGTPSRRLAEGLGPDGELDSAGFVAHLGDALLTASEKKVLFRDLIQGSIQRRIELPGGDDSYFRTAALAPGGEQLVIARREDGQLVLDRVELARGEVKRLARFEARDVSLTFDRKGELLALGTDDAVHVLRVRDGKERGRLEGDAHVAVAFDPKGKRLIGVGTKGMDRGQLTMWDLRKGKALRTIDLPARPESAAFTPDLERAVIADGAGVAVLLDLARGRVQERWKVGEKGSISQPMAIAFSADGETLVLSNPAAETTEVVRLD